MYLAELTRKRRAEEDLSIKSLPQKKRGHTVLLGADLDVAIQEYVRALRRNGGVVNTKGIMAAAKDIILSKD